MTGAAVDRAFVRLAEGLVHYRHAGAAGAGAKVPLVMAHGGPGSSASLQSLIAALGSDRRVVAPDMMGNGESDPPPMAQPDIAFYAKTLVAVMDHEGLDGVDLYGHHTGAQVVCEVAIAHPHRVRRLVLDGLGLFPDDQRAEFLQRYAPPIAPDPAGAHMMWVWEFISQTTQHFPHYLRDAEHKVEGGAALPPPVVTNRAAEVLKVWSTYHLAYRAAFAHDLKGRLVLLPTPALVLQVDRDPLARYAQEAAALIPGGHVLSTSAPQRASTLRNFLDG
jgi:pimeloyl-ACP methyl ester carboxylesterase